MNKGTKKVEKDTVELIKVKKHQGCLGARLSMFGRHLARLTTFHRKARPRFKVDVQGTSDPYL